MLPWSVVLRRCATICSQGCKNLSTQVSRIGVVGAPFEKGQTKPGVSDGPATIRKTGFISRLTELGHDVLDYGDVRDDVLPSADPGPAGEKHFYGVLQFAERLAAAVAGVRRDNRLCVTLGGDHSVAIGTVAGHCQVAEEDGHQVVVLWVDAHADLHTGASSPSGNMHGMSLGFLMSALETSTIDTGFPRPFLDNEHVAYIGLRDLDDREIDHIFAMGIPAYNTRDVDRLGVRECIARCLQYLQPGPTRPLHVSFDIDVLDPLQAPATGTQVAGGLTLREGCMILEAARDTGHLAALDLVEVNPALADTAGARRTADAARTLLMAALAGYRGT